MMKGYDIDGDKFKAKIICYYIYELKQLYWYYNIIINKTGNFCLVIKDIQFHIV